MVEPSASPTRSRRLKRTAVSALVAIAIVGLFGLGWFTAHRFESPAQRQADAAPPQPGHLFAKVTRGTLADQVSGSGTVSAAQQESVSLPQAGGAEVVTHDIVRVGQEVADGDAIAELDGKPLFVLSGQFDFYRNLGPGDQGRDVAQLQTALQSAGLRTTKDRVGLFGSGTAAAVRSMNAKAGYPASPRLDLTEVTVIGSLPATVESTLKVGAHASAGEVVAELGRGALVARISLSSQALVSISKGLPASISVFGAAPMSAVVAQVPAVSSSSAELPVTLLPRRPLPASQRGDVTVGVITIHASAVNSLLVPTRALVRGRDGTVQLVVERSGRRQVVTVTVTGELAGQSAVRSKQSALNVGDMVEVG